MAKLKLNETHREAIAAACQRHGVVLCYLFGSQAEGFAHARSDVDLAVVFRQRLSEGDVAEREVELEDEMRDIFSRREIQLTAIPVEDAGFNFQVVSKGELLYKHSELARAQFEERVWREWDDWEPFETAFERELSDAIHHQYANVR